MNLCYRNNPVNFGYVDSQKELNGALSYFYMLSATSFGSLRSLATRLYLKRLDPLAMKRPFIMSQPGDRVFVSAGTADSKKMAENFDFVRSLYTRAGIEPGEFIPFTGNPYTRIREEAQHNAIATIIYDPGLHKIFRHNRLMEAVRILNNKLTCMDHLKNHGIELPGYANVKPPVTKQKLRNALRKIGTPAYIKCGTGSGGNQVWRIDETSQIKKIPMTVFSGGYQIQKAVPGEDSYNIQYLILPDKIVCVLATRQRIINGSIHMGNDWPAEWSNVEYADRIAGVCQRLGYVGVLGLDMKELLLEVNARQNSSCIMPVLLQRIPNVEKLSISINHEKKSTRLAGLIPDKLWYRDGRGLLPYAWHDGPGRLFVAIINDIDGSIESAFKQMCPQT